MRWNKASLISVFIILTLVIFSSSVFASSYVTSSVIENSIVSGETAEFEVTITNNGAVEETYTIFSFTSGSGWSVDPKSLSDKVIEDIQPGESYTTKIVASPLEDFEPGIYHVYIQIDSSSGDSYDIPLKIYVGSTEPVEYLPAISVDVSLDVEIYPGEVQSILLNIENRNPLDLGGLTLEIQSDLEELNQVLEIPLEPLGSKIISLTAELDDLQQPKEYYIFFLFKQDGETIKIVEQYFNVISTTPSFDFEILYEEVFLKHFQTFVLTNEGNVENTQDFLYPVSDFSALFLNTESINVIEIDNQKYLSWVVSLNSGESTSLSVEFNYRVLFYLALFFLIFLIFYYIVKSPISLHKGAVTTVGKEGALHEIKIALEVRNRSNKSIKGLKVIDVIPGIANLKNNLELGTLKPSHVVSTKQGTKVSWEISELEPLEHRIITYKIRTKLNVLGTFKLPRSYAEYLGRNGKFKKAYSNSFRLDAGKVE